IVARQDNFHKTSQMGRLQNLWISQIFSGEPDMYILRRDTPIMIVSYQGGAGGHAACPLLSPE
ncbi:hypothetical protein, partial [Escherichia coli]